MKKNIKLIPLFLFLFVFQLLYFLSTIYTEKIDHMFLILAVFIILICILLYCVLSDVLKKSNTEMELAFLQKQKQLKQEQDYSLQIRRQDTRDFQTKTVQELQDFQILLEQGKYEQADTAIRNLNQTFQKDRFHPYCQNNLLQAILEGKRLRAEQKHIQVSYEILLPEKISINTTDLSSIFFNLLDNAIEACSSSGNPDPEIRLSANISNGFLTIYMHNTKNPLQSFTHKTTKSEPGAHGYGLSIIEDICQKYNGSYQWIDHNNTFDSIVPARTSFWANPHLSNRHADIIVNNHDFIRCQLVIIHERTHTLSTQIHIRLRLHKHDLLPLNHTFSNNRFSFFTPKCNSIFITQISHHIKTNIMPRRCIFRSRISKSNN